MQVRIKFRPFFNGFKCYLFKNLNRNDEIFYYFFKIIAGTVLKD